MSRFVFYTDQDTFERFESFLKSDWRFVDTDFRLLIPMQTDMDNWPVLVIKDEQAITEVFNICERGVKFPVMVMEYKMAQQIWQLVVFASFAVFVAGKVTGVFVSWSWWWLLMTPVPIFARVLGWA